jgi:hypothetical protein
LSEGQAGHGEQERKICPLYKAAAIISAKGLGMPVTCDGRSCGMWALCQGTKIYNPVPVKMIKDSPVGL